jgi:hypothetical protein
MGEKPVDLEWMDISTGAVLYDEAVAIILEKNKQLSTQEKRWRMPDLHDLQVVFQFHPSGFSLKQARYMCRSSRIDGRIVTVSSDGKTSVVDPKSHLHFCLVR